MARPFATVEEFEVLEDPEGQELFRGHLVIACANLEEDIELAEKITERFKKEFGKVSGPTILFNHFLLHLARRILTDCFYI
jgi:hypothetical protein